MKNLFEDRHWALTYQAQLALDDMAAMGIDADLALLVLERFWPETDIYELPTIDADWEALPFPDDEGGNA